MAAGLIVGYLEDTRTIDEAPPIEAPQAAGASDSMRLDAATQRHLELVESERGRERKGSLLDAVDLTVTPDGPQDAARLAAPPAHRSGEDRGSPPDRGRAGGRSGTARGPGGAAGRGGGSGAAGGARLGRQGGPRRSAVPGGGGRGAPPAVGGDGRQPLGLPARAGPRAAGAGRLRRAGRCIAGRGGGRAQPAPGVQRRTWPSPSPPGARPPPGSGATRTICGARPAWASYD